MKRFFVFLFLAVLLACPLPARAVPVTYQIQGLINLNAGPYEDFTGSFVLSDATIIEYEAGRSQGEFRTTYSISSFELASASYSFSSGYAHIGLWWDVTPNGVGINWMDSEIQIVTNGYTYDSVMMSTLMYGYADWQGALGEQPTTMFLQYVPLYRRSDGNFCRIQGMTAVQVSSVPEPSTVFLLGTGILGVVGVAQRRKSLG